MSKIQENGGHTQIDLSTDILPIIQRFIIQVIMGKDSDEALIDITKRVNHDGKLTFKSEKMSISDAVEEVFQQTMHGGVLRLVNPLWRLINAFTGLNPAFTAMEKQSNINCATLRSFIQQYVIQRKSGIE